MPPVFLCCVQTSISVLRHKENSPAVPTKNIKYQSQYFSAGCFWENCSSGVWKLKIFTLAKAYSSECGYIHSLTSLYIHRAYFKDCKCI